MSIEVYLNPPESVAKALSDGIASFNRTTIPDLEPNEDEVRFHVVAWDGAERVMGGLRGTCYWNMLHIELLWLSEDARGAGIGVQLIERAEAFAMAQGCELALVETTSWQAKPFYEKNGYMLMATLEGRPAGHASHYLHKRLGQSDEVSIGEPPAAA